ncbi:hypothetical protein JTB14_036762 [Gonioctena quinquepunctata]|nr:hypothetical protein JTB14_036762 [Gonioctena quinquepunctata]
MTCFCIQRENSPLKEQPKQQEQFSRLNIIEINGMPEIKEVITLRTTSLLFLALNVNIDEIAILCSYRIQILAIAKENFCQTYFTFEEGRNHGSEESKT